MARLPGEPPPFKDIARPPPERTIKMPDGSVRTEKLPPISCNMKMVDPNGHVVRVVLANGDTIKKLGPNNPYGQLKLKEKLGKGFLPYKKCPYAQGGQLAGTEHDEKPCKDTFTEEKCCHHIAEIIKLRRVDYVKKSRRFSAKTESQMERVMRTIADKLSDSTAERQSDGKLRVK